MLLSKSWALRLSAFKSIKVAFSGGLDSTVLLHVLANADNISSQVQALHVNHGISKHADMWQDKCQSICEKLGIQLKVASLHLTKGSGIEEAARNGRYAFFAENLCEGECLVLAHHQNDQAETLLFNLFRGAGLAGAAGMPEQRALGIGELCRPFLNISKERLLEYANTHNLTWVEDDSNTDTAYSRNFIRQQVLPLLTNRWPRVISNLTDFANKSAVGAHNLDSLAYLDCDSLTYRPRELDLEHLLDLSDDRLINVLRAWFKFNKVLSPSSKIYTKIIKEVIYARHDKSPKLKFSEFVVRRFRNTLYIVEEQQHLLNINSAWDGFPNSLYLEDGRVIEAYASSDGINIAKNSELSIRFRQGGEVICINGQTKKLKKVFQELNIPPWIRCNVPLLFVDGELKSAIGVVCADRDPKELAKGYNFKII